MTTKENIPAEEVLGVGDYNSKPIYGEVIKIERDEEPRWPMKVEKIEFGWNEDIVNPSDRIEIHTDKGVFVLEGQNAEEFILDIEELIKKYENKGYIDGNVREVS